MGDSWFSSISLKQRIWLFATAVGMLAIIIVGILLDSSSEQKITTEFNTGMSIKEIAPQLGVTGKTLARELKLPIDVSKCHCICRFLERVEPKELYEVNDLWIKGYYLKE